MMPEDEIAEYEKKFEKDRRARLREDKLREQEALQKERVQRALERAQAAPRNQVGRRPVPRSEPPRVKGSFQNKISESQAKKSGWYHRAHVGTISEDPHAHFDQSAWD